MELCKSRRLDFLIAGSMSDCTIRCASNQSDTNPSRACKCHKIALMTASPVFEDIINSPEFIENGSVIIMDDVCAKALETLVIYIYIYEIVNPTLDIGPDVIHLAYKYQIMDFLGTFLQKVKTVDWQTEYFIPILQMAWRYKNETTVKVCMSKITSKTSEVLNHETFLTLSMEELSTFTTLLKSLKSQPNREEMLAALKRYQAHNKIFYNNIKLYKGFLTIVNEFDNVLFDSDGAVSSV